MADCQSFGTLAAFRDAFVPARAKLVLPGMDAAIRGGDRKVKPARTVVGVESGQLGGFFKDPQDGLLHAMTFVAQAGGQVIMPSNYFLQAPSMAKDPFKIAFRPLDELRQYEEETGVKLGVGSAHCMTYSHMTVMQPDGLRLVEKFVPAAVLAKGAGYANGWCEEYILALLAHTAQRGVRILAMFQPIWGSMAIHLGYEWPFSMDGLILAGLDQFVAGTARVRAAAKKEKVVLAHEIHNCTGAQSADGFALILQAADYDPCLGVWGDPSHTDEGEGWTERLHHPATIDRLVGGHIKNFDEWPGKPKRQIETRWPHRGKRFCNHGEGVVPLGEYLRETLALGMGQKFAFLAGTIGGKYCEVHAYSEAEDWQEVLVTDEEVEVAKNPPFGDRKTILDTIPRGASAKGIIWCNQNLLMTQAMGAFSDTMGT